MRDSGYALRVVHSTQCCERYLRDLVLIDLVCYVLSFRLELRQCFWKCTFYSNASSIIWHRQQVLKWKVLLRGDSRFLTVLCLWLCTIRSKQMKNNMKWTSRCHKAPACIITDWCKRRRYFSLNPRIFFTATILCYWNRLDVFLCISPHSIAIWSYLHLLLEGPIGVRGTTNSDAQ